jgi:bifunctional DNA-binding transcriptional regulator/antitoxin component of YhaV-PrlF toxin-antitoxin module
LFLANKVGEKGQVVIETAIRAALGIEPGFVTVQHLKGDSVEIRFYPPEHELSLRGTLAAKVRRSVPARKWRGEKETAWKEAVAAAAGPEKGSR